MIKSGDRERIPGAMPVASLWFPTLTALWVVQLGAAIGVSQVTTDSQLPTFAEPLSNVTISVGRDVRLSCVIDNLGSYRVAWLRVESKTILTIHHHVITRNYRISLSTSGNREWILHINNVQLSDTGGYMCQINTEPMTSQVGYLNVLVPPDIIGGDTSADVMVREGSNVTLSCRAKGYPQPVIKWRREDGEPIGIGSGQSKEEVSYVGEKLTITKVSRLHMAAYLCIASNGVPPSVSRRVLLQVHFPPMIWIPNQLVGASVGWSVTLECHTEAYPMSINYWTNEEGDMIISNDKYSIENEEKTYKIDMKLVIKYVQAKDFGTYTCYAKNSLGSTEGAIRLYEIHLPSQPAKEPSTAKIHSLYDDDDIQMKQAEPLSKKYHKTGIKQTVADESEDIVDAQLHPPSTQAEDQGLTGVSTVCTPKGGKFAITILAYWFLSVKLLGT